MSNKTVTFNNFEDMTKFVLANTYNADRRWMLDSSSAECWANEEEGKAWAEMYDANRYVTDYHMEGPQTAERAAYIKEEARLAKIRPQKINYVRFYLVESDGTSSYRNRQIDLGAQLASMMLTFWKTTEYGRYRGRVTIPGLLKKLGAENANGMKNLVAEAKAIAKAEADKNARNYARREFNKLVEQMNALVAKNADVLNCEVPNMIDME